VPDSSRLRLRQPKIEPRNWNPPQPREIRPRRDLERAVLSGARGTLEDLALALEGWRLKLADQFDELLCLARTRDVRRLDHQVETVHRVLRTFCGRALLADEVGLGKTIEAGMLVSEYLLRGMARTFLVVCPAFVAESEKDLAVSRGGPHRFIEAAVSAGLDST
jgi:SNF2 family DNA or RNA helicase